VDIIKEREYGSEFWITDDDLKFEGSENGYIMGSKEIYLLNGRCCISFLLDSINNTTKRAVLPAYICNSAIEPFITRGFSVQFYGINKKLEPDIDEIVEMINGEPSVFMHMGYFGFATNGRVKEIEEKIKATESIIFEDRAHTLFSSVEKSFSDAEFSSIRKWIGIPGGGITNPINNIFCFKELDSTLSNASEKRFKLLRMKAAYIETGDQSLRELYRTGFTDVEKLMDDDKSIYLMDELSVKILKHLDKSILIKGRRENYKVILNHFAKNDRLEPVFKTLPDNVCPMFFPVFTQCREDRDSIQSDFASKGLYCPIHWPLSDYIKSLSEESGYVYNHILSIPCDQRYSESDMQKIIEIINN